MAGKELDRVKVLACTGGIGSGKTYVCRIFEKMGIPVYYSDDRAKALYADPEVKARIVALFGADVYTSEGRLDGKRLASIVFNDPEALKSLESVIHPAVKEDFLQWKQEVSANRTPDLQSGVFPVILESAILLERPMFLELADYVLTVTAPEDLRIRRVISRDGVTEEMVRSRISCQMEEKSRIERSDFVIFADDRRALLPQMHAVLEKIR